MFGASHDYARAVPNPNHSEFEVSVAPHRAELHAYCYRMLGSLQDAEDALQDALLAAYKGFAGLRERSALRPWLYRIASHACMQILEKRPKRVLAYDRAPSSQGVLLDPLSEEPVWLEPYPEMLDATFEMRESVELAFVAALQHLPATQRATLILREVLGFEASEVAEQLQTSVASVNSGLQRAREAVARRVPPKSQQATLRDLGDAATRELVTSFVDAWARHDVDALLRLLAHDAKFAMPPIPNWFYGHEAIGRFFRERIFEYEWRLSPMRANGQLAFACYQGPNFVLGALNIITLQDGKIVDTTGFLDPRVHARFVLPDR